MTSVVFFQLHLPALLFMKSSISLAMSPLDGMMGRPSASGWP